MKFGKLICLLSSVLIPVFAEKKSGFTVKDAKEIISIHISILENDIAHNRTYGFKALKEFLIDNDNSMRLLLDISQGTLEKTDNPLDIAPVGACFVSLGSGREGQILTRNGQFRVNSEKKLYHLLNPEIPLQIPEFPGCALSARIDRTGSISCINEKGVVIRVGALKLVSPIDQRLLKRLNSTAFSYEGAVIPQGDPGFDCAIEPGYLENSNVNPAKHMRRIKMLQNDLKELNP